MAYKFLIVDDEHLSRRYIHDTIVEFMPDSIINESDNAASALQYLQHHEIDILFLDIQMPMKDGLALLREIKQRSFQVVFITAFSDYAIPALREGAPDYILKPVKKSDLKEMLSRMQTRLSDMLPADKGQNRQYLDSHISLTHQHGLRLVQLRSIVYLKADNTYTTFFLSDGEKFISSKPISKYAEQLNNSYFFRIHKSYVINVARLKEYLSRDGLYALMDNGEKLHISRYRVHDFLTLLKSKYSETP